MSVTDTASSGLSRCAEIHRLRIQFSMINFVEKHAFEDGADARVLTACVGIICDSTDFIVRTKPTIHAYTLIYLLVILRLQRNYQRY